MTWNSGVNGNQVLPLINLDASTIRVEAGPGTGKTFGLVRRVHRIVHPDGLATHGRDVLVVAFNRIIAKQLRDDITQELTTFEHQGEPAIRTIHALCVEVIGEDVRLLLPHEREAMIYDVLMEHAALRAQYGRAEDADQALKDHEARNAGHPALWQAAERWLTRHRSRLISDLPGLLLDRLQGGDFAERAYRHVLVDEFQDLTPGEQQLVFRLRAAGGSLLALGDPRQSIYRFRGNDLAGLSNLEQLAGSSVADVAMTECQRCPAAIVAAANRLMALSPAQAMVPVRQDSANLHLVVWDDPAAESAGMARAILDNIRAYPEAKHLVMVTRRQFGYSLRKNLVALDPALSVDLSFSEGLLESWAAREAFLLFCLLFDPDRPSWRAWFAYSNSTDGKGFKAPSRNAGAYLQLLASANDEITFEVVEALAAEERTKQRGKGGTTTWDRARRLLDLRESLKPVMGDDATELLETIFQADRWLGMDYSDKSDARSDLGILKDKAIGILAEETNQRPTATPGQLLAGVARRLRQHIATREPLTEQDQSQLQVATLWGAKGVTADHVYLLGACAEALPGQRRKEYPGTDADFVDEQRRLFYVSITRAKRTLVISRAAGMRKGDAQQLGMAVPPGGYAVTLRMSPFLREIMPLLPTAVPGATWSGCT